MQYRHTAGRMALAHVAGRIIHGVFNISIFNIVRQFLHSHHRAVVLGLLCGSAQVRQKNHVVHVSHLGIGEVAHIAVHLSGLQGRSHIVVIYQGIPGKIQNHNAILHHVQLLFIDHSLCAVRERHMDGDIIALLENHIRVGDVLYVPGKPPGRIHRDEGIIAVDLHPQMGGRIGHLRADGAQADDAQLFAADFPARKSLLALLRIFGDIGIFRVFLTPAKAAGNIAGSHEKPRNHQLLHAVGVGPGRVEHHDALLGAGLQGNIVYAGSGPANGKKALRKLHLMHGGAAHQDAVRLRQRVRQLIIRGKQVGPAGSNRV